jgi:hypothetical protein
MSLAAPAGWSNDGGRWKVEQGGTVISDRLDHGRVGIFGGPFTTVEL